MTSQPTTKREAARGHRSGDRGEGRIEAQEGRDPHLPLRNKPVYVIDKLTGRIVETYPSVNACADAKGIDRAGTRRRAVPGRSSNGWYWYRLKGASEPIAYEGRGTPVVVKSPTDEMLFFPCRQKAARFLEMDHVRMSKKSHGWTRKDGNRWYWRLLKEPLPNITTSKPDPDNYQARILLDGDFTF